MKILRLFLSLTMHDCKKSKRFYYKITNFFKKLPFNLKENFVNTYEWKANRCSRHKLFYPS